MILRSWRGRTRLSDAEAYLAFLNASVLPELQSLGGRGAYVLRRDDEAGAEFWVLSLWDSLDAVRAFAGPEPERAVVPAEARRLLTEFDPLAVHFDVVHAPEPSR